MKILLTTHQFLPKYYSGTEILARDTGLEMLRRGHGVHVLTVDPAAKKSIDVRPHDYDYRGLKVRALTLPKRRSPLVVVRDEYDNDLVADHVRRYVRRLRPDAVHMFSLSRLSGAVIEVFRELGVPVVFTPTDFWAICARSTLAKPSGELSTGPDEISSNCLECWGAQKILPKEELPQTEDRRAYYREIAERALQRREGEHPAMERVRAMLFRTEYLRGNVNSVDAILAPTELMHRMLTSNGIRQDLVTVSPYGMDLSGFAGAGRVGQEPGRLRVGFIGTIHSQKGVDVLVRAFQALPADGGFSLRIAGDLTHHKDYGKEVYALAGGDPRINFAGPFSNEKMAAELGKIDVLVVPSTWYENTPLVIYSAFAAGIPVVASNLGGMAEVVHHGRNGLLFEPGDARDLARQLERLAADPGLLRELGRNVGAVRPVEDSVDEMLSLYDRLRERKRRLAQRARRASSSAEDWLWLNGEGIRENPGLKEFVAPLPPAALRDGLSESEFAGQGTEIYGAMLDISPLPWQDLRTVLDYGCGAGKVARLFAGRGKELHGAEADPRRVEWLRKNLTYLKVAKTDPDGRLPHPDDTFDAVYATSVLDGADEERHRGLLSEIARVSKPGAVLFLGVPGEGALQEALEESEQRGPSDAEDEAIRVAARRFREDGYAFVAPGEGRDGSGRRLAFVPASFVRRNWGEWFDLVEAREGGFPGPRDLVVLRVREEKPRFEIPARARPGSSTVSEHWARNVEARQSGEFAGNWLDHRGIQRLHINPMSTGDPEETWFPYVAKKYFPEPVDRGLSLGCGGGALERHALAMNVCRRFDAFDISEGSVEAAREEARKAGLLDRIDYGVADLNAMSLEADVYDAAFASMAIHHIENLEGLFSELNKAIKPGGLLVFNEFVGPSQFQWTERQLALANELLLSIPERYRVGRNGRVMRRVDAPTIERMNEVDPSESIRSAEIMPLLGRYFEVVERKDYGGTLLHIVTTADTINNFSSDKEEDLALLRRMIDFEKRHIAAGEIESDFTLVIARNPGAGGSG